MAVHADSLGSRLGWRSSDTLHAAGNGGGPGCSAAGLARPREGAEWWVTHVGVVVGGKIEADQAVVVLEDFRVALDG